MNIPRTTVKLKEALRILAEEPMTLFYENEEGEYEIGHIPGKTNPHKEKGYCYCDECCAKRITEDRRLGRL
jgi:hypothetical protein